MRNPEFLLSKTSMQNLSAIGQVVSELLSVKDRLVGSGRARPGRVGPDRAGSGQKFFLLISSRNDSKGSGRMI